MPEHLVFTLAAALGAMGEFAGHERRGSLDWPGRSAVIGLIGAAMGLRRDGDFAALDAMGMAVAVFDEGTPLRDYHTVQTVPAAAVKKPQSRPEALRLAGGKVNTALTSRDYRMGPLFGVCVWNGPLSGIAMALERPRFTVYLGRKSCPLSAPMAPRIVVEDGPVAALGHLVLPPWCAGTVGRRVIADEGVLGSGHSETRNDLPLDRSRWHFGQRRVDIAAADIRPSVAGAGA